MRYFAGMVVRYRGDNSSGRKPILLLGHLDVVQVLAEDCYRDLSSFQSH